MPLAAERTGEVLRAFIYSLQNTATERLGRSDSFSVFGSMISDLGFLSARLIQCSFVFRVWGVSGV